MKRIMLLLLIFAFVPQLTFADYDHGLEAFNQGDYATALKNFRAEAEQGHAGAQYSLGNMYEHGRGVPRGAVEAIRWYKLSAEQEFAPAQFRLGILYLYGLGLVNRNPLEAARWIRLAAEQGYVRAQAILGGMYADTYDQLMGREHGVPRDDAEAVRWYRLAADQGDKQAQSSLGYMYQNGLGVFRNYPEAVRWYRMAAEKGCFFSQHRLGIMYRDGLGVLRNYIQAYKWFSLSAASAPIEEIIQNLNAIQLQMTREQIAEAQRLAAAFKPRDQVSPQISKTDELKLVSTGTGFFVSNKGHVLTNQHVVDSCAQVRVNVPTGTSNASILAEHQNDDLALLFAEVKPAAVASFRRTAAEVGEDVSVAGYPLHGLLGGLNITSGSVASATGLRGDARYLQISAPVQPGNSGGPLLDSAGTVVGVVVAKLDAIAVAQAIGDIPQNVNFAIKSAVARSFLSIHGIAYQESTPRRDKTRVAIAAEAQQHTVLVECWK